MQTLPLGTTHLPQDIINDFLQASVLTGLCAAHSPPPPLTCGAVQEQRSVFTPQAYNLFDNNCNNFTDTFANFLVGSGIPVRPCG